MELSDAMRISAYWPVLTSPGDSRESGRLGRSTANTAGQSPSRFRPALPADQGRRLGRCSTSVAAVEAEKCSMRRYIHHILSRPRYALLAHPQGHCGQGR